MQMILQGKTIKEIPVEMNQRTTGVSSISPLKSINYMVKVILSLFINGLEKIINKGAKKWYIIFLLHLQLYL